ncbi:MAG: zf-HC2 domain-containing protein [Chloroflexia bacterium]
MRELTCAQLDKLVEAYVDGRLAAEMSAAVTDHMATCPACRAQSAAAEQLQSRLGPTIKAVRGPGVLQPAEVARLRARLGQQRGRLVPLGVLRTPLALATLILILVAITSFAAAELGGVSALVAFLPQSPTPTLGRELSVPVLTSNPTPQPDHTPVHEPTHEPMHTPTHEPAHTPTHTPTHVPQQTPTYVPTPVPPQTPTHVPQHTPVATPHTPVPTHTAQPTHPPLPTHTPIPVPTHTAQPTHPPPPTHTPMPEVTYTPAHTPGVHPTDTPLPIHTVQPTHPPAHTPTPDATYTPAHTPGVDPTHGAKPTSTPEPMPTPHPTLPPGHTPVPTHTPHGTVELTLSKENSYETPPSDPADPGRSRPAGFGPA